MHLTAAARRFPGATEADLLRGPGERPQVAGKNGDEMTKPDDFGTSGLSGDRRHDTRHIACFPAYIEARAGEQRSAIIRDLSVTGAMLLTRAELQPGDRVRLSLYISDDLNAPGVVTGAVVRVEPWGDGTTLWSFTVGIQFDEPAAEHEQAMKELADKQASLGLFQRPSRPPPVP